MRNLDGKEGQSWAGSLLAAHPNMLDPNFRRAVLFLSAHEPDEGAMGIIINRPLDKQISDLVSETPPGGLADVPVFLGGPVGTDKVMLATFEWEKGQGLRINSGASLEQTTLGSGATKPIYAFVGYAGWEAGQLEAEMKQNAWVLQKPSRSMLKPDRLPKLWFDIMNKLGPWYKMLAAAPDDPSLN